MANTGSAGASSADELGYISDDDLLDGITEDLFSDADAVNDWIRGTYGQFALDVLWGFNGRHLEEINNEISD